MLTDTFVYDALSYFLMIQVSSFLVFPFKEIPLGILLWQVVVFVCIVQDSQFYLIRGMGKLCLVYSMSLETEVLRCTFVLTSPKSGVHLLLIRLQSQQGCFSLCMCTCDHNYLDYIILIGLDTLLEYRLSLQGKGIHRCKKSS